MGEKRGNISRRAFADAKCDEEEKQGEGSERSPVLECSAEADATIVERGEERSERESDDEGRKINRVSGDAVDFERIEPMATASHGQTMKYESIMIHPVEKLMGREKATEV